MQLIFILTLSININSASFDEIYNIVKDSSITKAVILYRIKHNGFKSIYELNNIKGISPELFTVCKKNFSTYSTSYNNRHAIYLFNARIRLKSEDRPDNISIEQWQDRLIHKININTAEIEDLLNIPGVSIIDAKAVLLFRKNYGNIRNSSTLKWRINDLSNYGYRNLLSYITYKDYEAPYFSTHIKTYTTVDNNDLYIFNRITISTLKHLKIGLLINQDSVKGYGALYNISFLKRLYIGYIRPYWDEGLMLAASSNNGIRSYKHTTGIFGDVISSRAYSLMGTGIRIKLPASSIDIIGSMNKRNGYLNPDSTVNILFNPPSSQANLLNIVDEKLIALRYRFHPYIIGSAIALSAMMIDYSRPLRQDFQYLDKPLDGHYLEPFEYSTLPQGKRFYFGSFAFKIPFRNYAISGQISILNNLSYAAFIRQRIQFRTFYTEIILRRYEPEYYNPYFRGFSEQTRFDDTEFSYDYRLSNKYFSYIEEIPVPKPEQGIFTECRYQFSSHFLIPRAYLDIWQNYAIPYINTRFQGSFEVRPIFPVRFRIGLKLQKKYKTKQWGYSYAITKEPRYMISTVPFQNTYIWVEYRPSYVDIFNTSSYGSELRIDLGGIGAKIKLLRGNLEGAVDFWNGDASSYIFDDEDIHFVEDIGTFMYIAYTYPVSKNTYMYLKLAHKKSIKNQLIVYENMSIKMEVDILW